MSLGILLVLVDLTVIDLELMLLVLGFLQGFLLLRQGMGAVLTLPSLLLLHLSTRLGIVHTDDSVADERRHSADAAP